MSYKTTTLGNVAEVASGGGAPQGQDSFSESGTPFVRAGSLPLLLKGVKEEKLELLTDEVAKKHKLRLFPKYTVLFAKSGMSATKGYIYQLKKSCYVVNHLAAIIPTENLSASFLKYWFQIFSPSRLIQDEAYPSIRLSDIKNIEIPLPPLPEQKRIAEVLDKADALREKRRLALQKLDTLLQSVFLEMFGDPVKNPKGWELKTLQKISRFSQGTQVPLENQIFEKEVGYERFLRISDYTTICERRYVKSDLKYYVNQDDIVVVRYGASAGFIGMGIEGILANNLFKISFDKSLINPIFLFHFLNTQKFKLFVEKVAFGAAMPALSFTTMNDFEILVPPIELQNEFSEIVRKINQMKNQNLNSLNRIENLFQSLQQRAFKGELFNDEFSAVEPQDENVWQQTSLF